VSTIKFPAWPSKRQPLDEKLLSPYQAENFEKYLRRTDETRQLLR
jgi:hypothetical protein